MWTWMDTYRARMRTLDAVRDCLKLQDEIALEIDRLAEQRELLLEKSKELLDKYGEAWDPSGTT